MAIIKKSTKKLLSGLCLLLGLFLFLLIKSLGIVSLSKSNFRNISLIEKIIGISKVKAEVPGDGGGDGSSGSDDGSCSDGSDGSCGSDGSE